MRCFVSAISCSAHHLVCGQFGMGRDLPVGSGIVAPCGWLSIAIAIHFCRRGCAAVRGLSSSLPSLLPWLHPHPRPMDPLQQERGSVSFRRAKLASVCSVFPCPTSCNLGLEYYFPCLLVKVIRKKMIER